MNIALIVHGFPPLAHGGTEIHTHDLAQAFLELGHRVTVISREADPEAPEYRLRQLSIRGVDVYLVNNTFRDSRRYEDAYRNSRIDSLVGRLLDDIQPDVAHIQHLTCLSTGLVDELCRRRIKTIFTLNDYWLICQRGQLLDLDSRRCSGPDGGCYRCADAAFGLPAALSRARPILRQVDRLLPSSLTTRLRASPARSSRQTKPDRGSTDDQLQRMRTVRLVASGVNLFLAPSQTLRNRFIDFGIDSEKIRFFEQGIDLTPFENLTPTSSDRLRIGFLGSLMESKAPHLLLKAFAGLPAGAAKLELLGALAPYHGDDSYTQSLEPLLDAPGVNFRGPLPHAEIPLALASLDVVVVPSVWLENAPFVMREAFAAGVPVVASELGGMAELVDHGVNGLLFPVGDAGALRRSLKRFLDEPELLPKLRSGIPKMKSIRNNATGLLEIYRSSLPESSRPRKLAVVVLNYQTPRDTVLAVRSIEKSQRPVDSLYVVDNGSRDDSTALLRRHLEPGTLIESDTNRGFSGGCNLGIERALGSSADLVLLLNADAILTVDCLRRLEEALSLHPSVGIVGPLVLAANDPRRVSSRGTRFSNHTGRMTHFGFGERHSPKDRPRTELVSAVDGCVMMIRRDVFDAIGNLDEDYFFSFEDLDFCLRAARAGFKTMCVTDAIAYHQGSRAIGIDSPQRLYFATRNHLLLGNRAAPLPQPLSWLRGLSILGLNLAHGLKGSGVPRAAACRATYRGALDHLRRRYGPAPVDL